MARRSGRRVGSKRPGKRMCIVTEGRVTEREYLEALRTRLGISKDLVRIDYTAGYNDVVSLMQYVIRRSRERGSSYEEWWVVADSEGKENAVREAQSLAHSHKEVNLAISRPCFEIWPILHIDGSSRQYNSPSECQKVLDGMLDGYLAGRKRLRPYVASLIESVPNAVRNARRIRTAMADVGSPSPTDMDLLVARLNEQAAPGDAFDL